MVSITFPLDERSAAAMDRFSWVNWSEVARTELMKREILERFLKTGTLTSADQEFCDNIDWYPVDELPLKEEFIKELRIARKEPKGRSMTPEEFKRWAEQL